MLTVGDVATQLNLSPACIYALVESRQLSSHRFGKGRGAIRISETDLAEFVARCLLALNESLGKIKTKGAFEQAQRMNQRYTDNPEFRLMFLRADNFEIENAALRIVRHFESKLELFGPDKLARDITLDDLTAAYTNEFIADWNAATK